MNNDDSLASFLSRKLFLLNSEHRGVTNVASNENTSIQRIRDAIHRANKNLDKIEFENIEIDKSEVMLKIPDAFNKQKMYEAVASKNHYFGDGSIAGKTALSVQIIL